MQFVQLFSISRLIRVNLGTGEVGGISIYEPHSTKVADLFIEWWGEYFCFLRFAGVSGYCMGEDYSIFNVHAEANHWKKWHFSISCCEICFLNEFTVPSVFYSDGTVCSP